MNNTFKNINSKGIWGGVEIYEIDVHPNSIKDNAPNGSMCVYYSRYGRAGIYYYRMNNGVWETLSQKDVSKLSYEDHFSNWMKKNYPNLRLDSVTAGFYREVFFGALSLRMDTYVR